MFTALLIAILIVAGAATVVGGGLVIAAQRRKGIAAPEAPKQLTDGRGDLLERGIGDLRAGDIIMYDGREYLVEGTLNYDEDGHRWVAGRLVDGDDVVWLVVGMERVGAGNVRLVKEDPSLDVSGYPPETIVHAGNRFLLEKRGNATVKTTGDAGNVTGTAALSTADTVSRCRWWQYETAGQDCLIVEQWSSSYRSLLGKSINPVDIEMLPGS
jgi:hypothetical protein